MAEKQTENEFPTGTTGDLKDKMYQGLELTTEPKEEKD